MNYIEIFWESGSVKYSELSLPFSDHQSEPILIRKPKLTRSLLFNYSIENSTLTFDLISSQIEENIEAESLVGTKVQLFKYNGGCLFTGFICEFPKAKEEKNIISFKADIFYLLESPANKVIKDDEFPDAGNNLGKFSNIIIGNETAGWYVALCIETGKYLAAWNSVTITKAELKDGTDIFEDISTNVDPTTGHTYIYYSCEEKEIHFNAEGPLDQGGLIENPASMLNYLLSNFSTLQIENLSESENIYTNRNYDNNFLFINDGSTFLDIFKSFSQSYNCRIVYTREGNISLKLIKWVSETPLLSLEESQMKNFQKWKETKTNKKEWFRKYKINPTTKQYNMTPLDLEAETAYSQKAGEFLQKYILDNSVSLDVGTRDAYLNSKPIFIYGFEVPEDIFILLELGDTLEIRHRDSYFPDQQRVTQILRLQNVEKSGLYGVEVYDIHEIQGTPFILREEGHPQNPVLYEEGNPLNPKIWWSN